MGGCFRAEIELLILNSCMVLPLRRVCHLVMILFRDPGGGRPRQEALLPGGPWGSAAVLA